ncbi:MAG: hypothetical protein ACKOQ6_06715 [Bacteroidota bacterium]
MKTRPVCILILLLSWMGCSEEIDITAPYEETAAVFGLLNPNDSVQYIRISKAFLGEGNVYFMAQQNDSINYPDELEVRMERLTATGTVAESFQLTRVESIPRDSGLFYYPRQIYYSTNRPIREDGSKYRLLLRNTRTGYSATATTEIIPDINVIAPASGLDVDFSTRLQTTYKITSTRNAQIFDLDIVFRYKNIYPSGSITYDSVLISFADELVDPNSLQTIEFPYYRPDFFLALSAQIPVESGVRRRIDNLQGGVLPLEFRFYGGTEDLYTYSQLTAPSGSIVQERPLFTNVENGVGLFTSRLIRYEFRTISAGTKVTIDTSALTRNLNFEF